MRPEKRQPFSALGLEALWQRSAVEDNRQIHFREVVALEQQRLARRTGQGIRATVAQVQPGAGSAALAGCDSTTLRDAQGITIPGGADIREGGEIIPLQGERSGTRGGSLSPRSGTQTGPRERSGFRENDPAGLVVILPAGRVIRNAGEVMRWRGIVIQLQASPAALAEGFATAYHPQINFGACAQGGNMNSSRFRALRLLAPLALTAVAVFSGAAPEANAQTTCTLHYTKVNYYAEPEKTTLVGSCTSFCSYSSPPSCTGTTSPYSTVVIRAQCPFCTGGVGF